MAYEENPIMNQNKGYAGQEKKDLKLFDIHPFSDGKVGTYLSTKSPWIDGDGQILGTIYCGTALTHQLN